MSTKAAINVQQKTHNLLRLSMFEAMICYESAGLCCTCCSCGVVHTAPAAVGITVDLGCLGCLVLPRFLAKDGLSIWSILATLELLLP